MKLGNATSVFINYSIQDAIKMVSEAGYNGIDIWGGRPHVYRRDFSADELKSLREMVRDHGLTVCSFMPAFYRYPHSLSNPNPIVRADSVDYMKESMDNAVALGAELLLIVPDSNLHGQSAAESFQRMTDCIAEVVDYASQYEIKLGLEVTEMVKNSHDAMKVIHELGSDQLGVVMDSGHINLGKEATADAIRNVGDRLLQFHVNDNDGVEQQNLIPGEGNYDFQELFSLLRESGFKGFISLELAKDYGGDPFSAVKRSAQRLRKLMAH
jgi:protein FrlC